MFLSVGRTLRVSGNHNSDRFPRRFRHRGCCRVSRSQIMFPLRCQRQSSKQAMVVLYFEQRLIMICPVERGRESERGRERERERERERRQERREEKTQEKRRQRHKRREDKDTREEKTKRDGTECVCVCEGRKSERRERETRETRERKGKTMVDGKKYKQQHNNTHRCQCKTFVVVIILLPT